MLPLELIEEDRVVERGWGLHKSFRSEGHGVELTARALLRMARETHAQRSVEAREAFSGDRTFPNTPPTYSEPVYTIGFLV